MLLDDQGIPRAWRWHAAETLGFPDWGAVAEELARFGLDAAALRHELARRADDVRRLPDVMRAAGVEDFLIARLAQNIAAVAIALEAAAPTPGVSV